jgi:hypothetical protein
MRRTAAAGAGLLLPALALAAFPGCNQEIAHPKDASPIVRPDSEEGKKAIAESEKFLKLRREQEAKARKRLRSTPEEG